METYEQRYARFTASRQPPVSLRIAMEDFFAPDLPEPYREAYGAYLQKRIRPLFQALLEQEDLDKLEQVERLHWLTPALVEEFCHLAAKAQKPQVLVWLLQKKQETYGFSARNFDL